MPDRAVDRGEELASALDPFGQHLTVPREDGHPVAPFVREQLADLLQRHPEFAMEQDVLQAQQLLAPVVAIAVLAEERRPEQPDLVVVMQRAHRDPGEPGQLLDGVVALVVVLPQGDSIVPHAA